MSSTATPTFRARTGRCGRDGVEADFPTAKALGGERHLSWWSCLDGISGLHAQVRDQRVCLENILEMFEMSRQDARQHKKKIQLDHLLTDFQKFVKVHTMIRNK